ncbi:MAG: hypothetical protein ABI045_02685 [Flavobacteriales bacterium]
MPELLKSYKQYGAVLPIVDKAENVENPNSPSPVKVTIVFDYEKSVYVIKEVTNVQIA